MFVSFMCLNGFKCVLWFFHVARKTKTVGGLKQSDLKKNINGKIVSVKASIRAKKTYQKYLKGLIT